MTRDEYLTQLSKSLIAIGVAFVDGMMSSVSPAFHHDLEKHLRDTGQRYQVIIAPRGHAKSSVAACLLVLWHIFLEPYWRFLIGQAREVKHAPRHVVLISKTREEAIKRLDTVKAILGDQGEYSPAFRRLFGNWGEETAKKWTGHEVVLKDGTIIKALGTGQQARGLKKKHLRVTLLIVDDPEDEKNTRTEDAMSYNRRWLLQAVLPALDVETGRVVVIGTPINTQCMVVKLQDAEGWRVLGYRNDAEANASFWYDSATRTWVRHKGVLWPKYITRDRLLQEKKMAASLGMLSSYYREWECVIVGDEDQIFRPEYLKNWSGRLRRDGAGAAYLEIDRRGTEVFEDPLRIPVLVFTGVDPASSVAVGADRTAIVNIAVDEEDRIYVLREGVHSRLAPDQVVAAIAANHTLVLPTRGIVEVISAFEYIVLYLQRDYSIAYMRDKPRIKKVGEGSRLEALQPLFASGRVFLPEGADQVAREQLLGYPRAKDDWLDALEKCVRIRMRPQKRSLHLADGEIAPRRRRTVDWRTV